MYLNVVDRCLIKQNYGCWMFYVLLDIIRLKHVEEEVNRDNLSRECQVYGCFKVICSYISVIELKE